MSDPLPQVSPDGRFYWDGHQWVPIQPVQATTADPPTPAPSRIGGGLVIAGGTLAVIGTFLPWISATAMPMMVIAAAWSGISSPDGEIIAGVATVSALLGVVMFARRVSPIVPIVLLLTAVLAMWVVAVDYQDLNGRVQSLGYNAAFIAADTTTTVFVAHVGVGIYATGLGVVIWAIGGVAALVGIRKLI